MTRRPIPFQPASAQACVRAIAALCLVALCMLAPLSQQSAADDTGCVELDYSSTLPKLTSTNPAYSLADARFGVYEDYQCTRLVADIVTDEAGHGSAYDLPAGRYFIRQEQASGNFALSDKLHQVEVAIGKSAHVDASAPPNYSSPSLIVRLLNAETGNQATVGGAHLDGARLIVSYYSDGQSSTILAGPSRTWTFASDEHGEIHLSNEYLVDGSPLFTGPQDAPVLPVGHYTAMLEKAPSGFKENATSLTCDILDECDTDLDPICSFKPFELGLQVIRGDVSFRKVDENGRSKPGIPFMLSSIDETSGDALESHVVVTDESGDFSSDAARTLHSIDTNANDAAATPILHGLYKVDSSKLTSNAGTWFSLDSDSACSPADDALGALPFGSYVLQELPCGANAGTNLSSVQFSVYKDGFTTILDAIVGTTPAMTISTSDAADGDRLVRPSSNAVVSDLLSYRNLVPGKSYKLTTTANVKDTGEALKTPSGEVACAVTEITPAEKDGRLTVSLDLDTSGLAGRQIVIHEELVSEDGLVVHAINAEDEEQLLDVEPIINAAAYDLADKDGYVMGTDAVIVERISYEGLQAGRLYRAHVVLNDKATGNALRDAQGQIIEAKRGFTPESSTGYVDIELPVDTSGIAGHDIVVFDMIRDDSDTLIASHQDLENEAQTLKTVKLTTSASDKLDDDKIFDAQSHGVTIRDNVRFANLVVGEQYELHGALMDKETGAALVVNGKPVTAHVPFVPEKVSDSVDVEFTFDACEQTSEVLVVFETLMHDGNVVAEHADLDDVAQTVTSSDYEVETVVASATGQGSSTGKSIKMGDMLPRAAGVALVVIGLVAACSALVVHRRKSRLEPIARVDEPR